MSYRIQLAPTAAEAFISLHPEIRKQLRAGMKDLAENPYAGKILQNELSEFLTYRIKRYRIIYKIDSVAKLIKIYMIGHRADIYDLFSLFVHKR